MSEWKPIETAPRDGTRVLAFGWPTHHISVMIVVAFNGNGINELGWNSRPDDFTHWMPLPEPPEGEQE